MIHTVNGYDIHTSDMGRSGYLGVTVSPLWTLDIDKPFIAMQKNPVDDPILSKWLTAKLRGSLHLGVYEDAREAAYVSAMYRKNPEDVLIELYHNGSISVQFPAELYGIPVGLSKEDAQKLIQEERIAKKNGTKQKKPKKLTMADVLSTAREVVGDKVCVNVSDVRKKIEQRFNMGMYIDESDIRSHVESIVKYK